MDEFKVKTSLSQLEQEIRNLSNQQSELNFYEYESKFMEILRTAGKELLESSLGEVPKDRRKKKACNPNRQD